MAGTKDVFTKTLNNETFIAHGSSIDMINTGAAAGSWTGNARYNNQASGAVEIPIGDAYTLEYCQNGYENIFIDATGTKICIAIKK